MPYYQDNVQELENIRALIKHADPAEFDLYRIRDFLGYIQGDLEMLASLRRPDSLTLKRCEDGLTEITITIIADEMYAEDTIRKLWLETGQSVSDASPSGLPTPPGPSSTPQQLPESRAGAGPSRDYRAPSA
jgi:hypothetical protein